MLRVVGFALTALMVWAGSAFADCEHFKWPLAREKVWFAATAAPVGAGGQVDTADRAYLLALKPTEAAGYLLPLEKPAAPGTYGGVMKVAAIPKPGLYQVTLSREGWIDVIQDNARVKTRGVSRQRDCAEMRKSVRFQLNAGPAALQLSGVDSPSIAVAVAVASAP